MEKKFLLALFLSVLTLLFFHTITPPPSQKQAPVQAMVEEPRPPRDLLREPDTRGLQQAENKEVKDDTVILANHLLCAEISLRTGGIVSLSLKEYQDKMGDPYRLMDCPSPKYALGALFSSEGPIEGYRITQQTERSISLQATAMGGLEVSRIYTLRADESMLDANIRFYNPTGGQYQGTITFMGPNSLEDKGPMEDRYLEEAASIDGLYVSSRSPGKKSRQQKGQQVDWLAVKNKFFVVITKPFFPAMTIDIFSMQGKTGIGTSFPFVAAIGANAEANYSYVLFAGPKKEALLKKSGYGFERVINYGTFGAISKALLAILRFNFSLVKNWGVAIILLSVMLNLILFPLSYKSFSSMKKMQELQPELEKIKKECKSNQQKMQKEMMELYKKNNINPFGGCLPMLLQMPIFFALYQAIMNTVELKGATFLWIKDLSYPDSIPFPDGIILPFIGSSINILPIFMSIAMFFQQKLTMSAQVSMSADQKQQQQIMLVMMPIMFCFIFYNMPSALVLYWLINTVLMTVENKAIFTRQA